MADVESIHVGVVATVIAHMLARDGLDLSLMRKLPNYAKQLKVPRDELEKIAKRVLPEAVAMITGASSVEIIWKENGGGTHTSRFTASEPFKVEVVEL